MWVVIIQIIKTGINIIGNKKKIYSATAISGIVRDSSVKWYNKAIPENNTVTRNCDKYK